MTPKEIEIFGEMFAKGALFHVAKILIIGFALLWAINIVGRLVGIGSDDSDASNWTRSGLKLHTDHKTGIQYFSDGKGGLTVRVDQDGKPIVSK